MILYIDLYGRVIQIYYKFNFLMFNSYNNISNFVVSTYINFLNILLVANMYTHIFLSFGIPNLYNI